MSSFREEYGGWRLDRYISDEQRRAGEANAADYKPTYGPELQSITKHIRWEFDNACKLVEKISHKDRLRLEGFAVIKLRNERIDGIHDFISFSLRNRDTTYRNQNNDMYIWVGYVGPRWLSFYDEYLELKTLILSQGGNLD